MIKKETLSTLAVTVAYWTDDCGYTLDIVVISNPMAVKDILWCLLVEVRQTGYTELLFVPGELVVVLYLFILVDFIEIF